MTNLIEATNASNGMAFSTELRGVEYYARIDGIGRWEVTSHRKALGRRNVGTVRHFANVEQVAASIKAFANLDLLVNCEAAA